MDKSANNTLPLCAKGCGFFGSPATKNLCSKCYNDHLKEKFAVLAIPATNPFPCFKTLVIQTSSAAGDTAAKEIDSTTSATKTSNNRCEACKKKVRLPGFGCRCGKLFCVEHRYPEAHGCEKLVEYKEKGRARLAKENPIIMADKLENRV